MSTYTKTNWVDNSPPPIDAANLNKIEQGVADAHTEIDTHTADTSNPHNVTAAQAGADPAGTAASEVSTHAALTEGVHGLVKNNLSATVAPTVNDDETAGYAVKSIWMDQTNGKIYQCMDATAGAAVWKALTASGSGINYHDYGTITGGTLTIDAGSYDYVKATIGANTTISFTGWSGAGEVTLELVNGGAYTLTWPSGLKIDSGGSFSLTSSGTDILEFLTPDGGTTIYGFQAGEAMA